MIYIVIYRINICWNISSVSYIFFLLFIISLSWSLPHAHTLTNLNVPSVTSLLTGTKGHVSGGIHLCPFQDRRVSINNWAQGALSNHRTTLCIWCLILVGLALPRKVQIHTAINFHQNMLHVRNDSSRNRDHDSCTKLVMLLCSHSGYFETFI